MEIVEVPDSIELEAKIARVMSDTGLTRDEVIANAIDSFLCGLGF